jgi:hypothetical protein
VRQQEVDLPLGQDDRTGRRPSRFRCRCSATRSTFVIGAGLLGSARSGAPRRPHAAVTLEALIAEAEEAKWPRLTRGIGDFHVTVYSYAQFFAQDVQPLRFYASAPVSTL